MTKREKTLGVGVAALVGLLVVYMGFRALLLKRAAKLDTMAKDLSAEIQKMEREKEIYDVQSRDLVKMAKRTVAGDVNRASEAVRARLVELLQKAGLGTQNMQLTPSSGRKSKDYYQEVGWTVSDRGELESLMDFLYLLSTEPYLHRVENLHLAPMGKTGEMEVKLRYAAIVLMSTREIKLPSGVSIESQESGDLSGEQRELYDVIASRDFFRPYSKLVKTSRPERTPDTGPRPPIRAVNPDTYTRVVGLASWAGQPEIQVRNTQANKVTAYAPGQKLAGGEIVMVDYRPLPLPGKPYLNSGSRVILKIESDYWAVELGQNLSDRRKLAPGDLPEQLRSEPE